MKNPYCKVKVVTVVQVGKKRYVRADDAAHEYCFWHSSAWSNNKNPKRDAQALYEKLHRRIVPIFKRALGEA